MSENEPQLRALLASVERLIELFSTPSIDRVAEHAELIITLPTLDTQAKAANFVFGPIHIIRNPPSLSRDPDGDPVGLKILSPAKEFLLPSVDQALIKAGMLPRHGRWPLEMDNVLYIEFRATARGCLHRWSAELRGRLPAEPWSDPTNTPSPTSELPAVSPRPPASVEIAESLPALHETAQKLAEEITRKPRQGAKFYARAIGITEEHMRRLMSQRLSKRGFRHEPGIGYVPPDQPA